MSDRKERILTVSEFFEYMLNSNDPEAEKVWRELPPIMQATANPIEEYARATYSTHYQYSSVTYKPTQDEFDMLKRMGREFQHKLNEDLFPGYDRSAHPDIDYSRETLDLSPTQYEVIKKEENLE